MRVLFTSRPGMGHYYPMRPLMSALVAAGDDVAVASGASIAEQARADGFTAYRVGLDNDDPEVVRRRKMISALPPAEIRRAAFSEMFVRTELPPRARELDAVVEQFLPDVVVHETAEFAGPLVASSHDIPYATHAYGPLLGHDAAVAAGEAAAPFWQERGLEPHVLAGLYEHLYLDICPPSLQVAAIEDLERVHRIGPTLRSPAHADRPVLGDLTDLPVVYLTLGTVHNKVDVFTTILDGLSRDDLAVVVTVGRNNDPAALGPQPPNVHVHQFVEQDLVLPLCALAVAHGGAGSTLGALAHGVPLLVVPQAADQFYNAERVAAAGAGISITPDDFASSSVAVAAHAILTTTTYRDAARSIATEFAAMPEPAAARRPLIELAESPRA